MPVEISIDEFLNPLSEGNGAGVEIDYTSDYLSLERELLGKSEQQYGDTIIPAEEPDWRLVFKLSTGLLAKSKDFRVAVALIRAMTNIKGIKGCIQGIELMLALVKEYWENGFPSLEYDGERDFFPRANALAPLHAADAFIKDCRRISINLPGHGSITLGEIERVFNSKQETDGQVRTIIENSITRAAHEGHESYKDASSLNSHLIALLELLSEKFEAEFTPDLAPLLKITESPFKAVFAVEKAPELVEQAYTAPASSTVKTNGDDKEIIAYSREDIIARLNFICAEIEKNEPSNPAPLLIKRAIQMVGLDFLSIMKNLAPDGLSQVYNITGQNGE